MAANNKSGASKGPTPTELKVRNALLEDENDRLKAAANQRPAPGTARAAPPRATTPTAASAKNTNWARELRIFLGWLGLFGGAIWLGWFLYQHYPVNYVPADPVPTTQSAPLAGTGQAQPSAQAGGLPVHGPDPAAGLPSPVEPQQVAQAIAPCDACSMPAQHAVVTCPDGTTVEATNKAGNGINIAVGDCDGTKTVLKDRPVPAYHQKPWHLPKHRHLRNFVPPVAGYTPPVSTCGSTCTLYKRLQGESSGDGQVCLYVVQREPSALVLRDGPYNTGAPITGWENEASAWHPWARDNSYVARQICFSSGLVSSHSAVTLCGKDDHSTWKQQNIGQLVSRRRIPESDPACLLGSNVCARYGL